MAVRLYTLYVSGHKPSIRIHEKTEKSTGLTLVDVVNHMSGFKQEMNERFATKTELQELRTSMESGFSRMEERFDRQNKDIDRILGIRVFPGHRL